MISSKQKKELKNMMVCIKCSSPFLEKIGHKNWCCRSCFSNLSVMEKTVLQQESDRKFLSIFKLI